MNHLLAGVVSLLLFAHPVSESPFLYKSVLPSQDTLINAGGHHLHFVVTKREEPTILLEAGGGSDATQWEAIQEKLARETHATIISYDRAGFGKSELPNSAYDIEKEIQDLNRCLKSLGVNKIILVGHSYGALLNQAYQFIYPEDIQAIILVDPNNVTFVDSIGVKNLMRIPFDTTKPLTIKQKADVRQTVAFNKTIETLKGMPYSKVIPITVITAGKDWWPFLQWNRWWKKSQQSLADQAPNRTLIIAEDSYHNIPKEQPDIIVAAIEKMLNKVSPDNNK